MPEYYDGKLSTKKGPGYEELNYRQELDLNGAASRLANVEDFDGIVEELFDTVDAFRHEILNYTLLDTHHEVIRSHINTLIQWNLLFEELKNPAVSISQ